MNGRVLPLRTQILKLRQDNQIGYSMLNINLFEPKRYQKLRSAARHGWVQARNKGSMWLASIFHDRACAWYTHGSWNRVWLYQSTVELEYVTADVQLVCIYGDDVVMDFMWRWFVAVWMMKDDIVELLYVDVVVVNDVERDKQWPHTWSRILLLSCVWI